MPSTFGKMHARPDGAGCTVPVNSLRQTQTMDGQLHQLFMFSNSVKDVAERLFRLKVWQDEGLARGLRRFSHTATRHSGGFNQL